jgi:hypothetical protein
MDNANRRGPDMLKGGGVGRLREWWTEFWWRRAEAEHPPIRRRVWAGPTNRGPVVIEESV